MNDDPADDPRSRTGEGGETTTSGDRGEHGGGEGGGGESGDDERGERDGATADERDGVAAGGPEADEEGEGGGVGASSEANGTEDETTERESGSDGDDEEASSVESETATESETDRPPEDVRKYERFKKVDGAQYDRVNDFLRERTYITAREWAIARLCADFRTETGVEMTKIGNNLPELVPFMTDTYSPQAVNQARHAFRDKVRKSGATFLYGAMCGFFTAEELDELMYEVSEIAKFLLEVEGVDLAVAEELEAEERISSVMREVREASSELRAEDLAEASDD
ncbi:DUF5806 family protein [Salinigranum rubrum]|uniref:DUF5806 family protein n=1 Tax=Salinigranum rubrum TaxID=755307 RepID=UPI001FED07A5|nr:DUF5806 family protein [Salinigranum rubrum]